MWSLMFSVLYTEFKPAMGILTLKSMYTKYNVIWSVDLFEARLSLERY